MRALFENWLEWDTRALPGGCLFVVAAVEFDDEPGPVRDELVRNQVDLGETIARIVRTGIAEGHLRDDVDPEQFALPCRASCSVFTSTAACLPTLSLRTAPDKPLTPCSMPHGPERRQSKETYHMPTSGRKSTSVRALRATMGALERAAPGLGALG